jgi:hypothetical protein
MERALQRLATAAKVYLRRITTIDTSKNSKRPWLVQERSCSAPANAEFHAGFLSRTLVSRIGSHLKVSKVLGIYGTPHLLSRPCIL